MVDYWIDGAFTEADRERSRPDPAGRRLSAGRSFDGHINLSGWLDPIHGFEFLEEVLKWLQETAQKARALDVVGAEELRQMIEELDRARVGCHQSELALSQVRRPPR